MAISIVNKSGGSVFYRKRGSSSWDSSSTELANDATLTVASDASAYLFKKGSDFSGSVADSTTGDYLYYNADGYHIAPSGTASYDLEDSDSSSNNWIGWSGSYSSPSAIGAFDVTAPQPAASLAHSGTANQYTLTVNFGEAVGSSARYPNAAALDSSSGLSGFTFSVVDHSGDAISGASAAVSSISHSAGASSATATVTISGVSTYDGDEHLKMVYSQSASSGKIYDASAQQIADSETIVALLPLLNHNNGDIAYSQVKLDTRQFEGNGTTGAVELAETVQIVTAVIPQNAAGSLNLGSTDKELGDVFLADSKALQLGSGQDVVMKWNADSSTHFLDLNVTGNMDADIAGKLEMDATDDSNITVAGSGKDLTLSVSGGSTQKLVVSSAGTGADAVDIDASAGGITMDAAGAVSIQGADDSDITVNGSAKDLSLVVSGGGAQKLIASSAGTGTDAIDIDASAGGIDIDAAGAVALDASSSATTISGISAGNWTNYQPSGGSDVTISSASVGSLSGELATIDGSSVDSSYASASAFSDGVVLGFTSASGFSSLAAGDVVEYTGGSGGAKVLTFTVASATSSSITLDGSGSLSGSASSFAPAGGSMTATGKRVAASAITSGMTFTFSSPSGFDSLQAGDTVVITGNGSKTITITVASASNSGGTITASGTPSASFSGSDSIVANSTTQAFTGKRGVLSIQQGDVSSAMLIGTVGAHDITLGKSGQTVTIPGNLTVNGATTTISTTELTIEDHIIVMDDGSSTPQNGAGIEIGTGSSAKVGIKFLSAGGQDSDGAFHLTSGSSSFLSLKMNDLEIDGNKIKAANLDPVVHGDLTAAMTDKLMVLNASSGLGKALTLDELFQAMSDRHISLAEKAPLGGESAEFVAYSGVDAQLAGTRLFTLPSGASKFAGAMVQVFVNGVALRKVDGTSVEHMQSGALNSKAYYVLSDQTIRFGADCFPVGAKCVISYFKQQDTVS